MSGIIVKASNICLKNSGQNISLAPVQDVVSIRRARPAKYLWSSVFPRIVVNYFRKKAPSWMFDRLFLPQTIKKIWNFLSEIEMSFYDLLADLIPVALSWHLESSEAVARKCSTKTVSQYSKESTCIIIIFWSSHPVYSKKCLKAKCLCYRTHFVNLGSHKAIKSLMM